MSYPFRFSLCMFLLTCPAFPQVVPVITTAAGTDFIFDGERLPAIQASFGMMYGLAGDPLGNLYAADRDNCLITKIRTDGILEIVGGNGICGSSGDGGPARNAALLLPLYLSPDASGNIYFQQS